MSIDYTKGDLEPVYEDALTADGTPYDLTGCTVRFVAKNQSSGAELFDRAGVVLDASAGTVQFTPAAGDTDTVGRFLAQWIVTTAEGKTRSFPTPGFLLFQVHDSADVEASGGSPPATASSVAVYGWAVAVATTNVALSGIQLGASAGEPVLLAGQTDASENGLWIVSAGAWARPSNASPIYPGALVYVTASRAFWVLDATSPPAVDTDAQTWVHLLSIPQTIEVDGATTATPSADITAALAAGTRSFRLRGAIVAEAMITITGGTHDGVTIEAEPGCTVYPPQNADRSRDDDGALAWLRAVPQVHAQTTVLASAGAVALGEGAKKDDWTITVSDAAGAGIVAGSWIRIDRAREVTFDPSTGTLTSVDGSPMGYSSNQRIRMAPGDTTRDDATTAVLPSAISALPGSYAEASTSLYVIPVSSTTCKVSSSAGPGAALTGGTAGTGPLWVIPHFDGDAIYQQDAARVQPRTLYQVESVATNVLTLRQPLAHFAPLGCVVRRVSPVLNLTVRGIDFTTNLDGACPSGIRIESGAGCLVEDVTVAGFSRAGVDLMHCRDSEVRRPRNGGRCNAVVLTHTAVECVIRDGRQYPGAPSGVHEYGIPRAAILERHRAVGGAVIGNYYSGHAAGIRCMGRDGGKISGNRIANCHDGYFDERDPSLLYGGGTCYASGAISVGIYVPGTHGEYSRQLDVSENECTGNTTLYAEAAPPYRWSAQFIIGDVWGCRFRDNVAGNGGRSPATAGAYQCGFAFFDAFDVSIPGTVARGQYFGVTFFNQSNVYGGDVLIVQTSGGGGDQYGFIMRDFNIASRVSLDSIVDGTTYPFVELASGVIEAANQVAPPECFRVARATRGGAISTDLHIAQNRDGGAGWLAGDIVEQYEVTDSGVHNPVWRTPTAVDARRQAVVWGYGAGLNAYCLVARGGARYVRTASGHSCGDYLRSQIGSRLATVDNAAAYPIGVASAYAAAGGGVVVDH